MVGGGVRGVGTYVFLGLSVLAVLAGVVDVTIGGRCDGNYSYYRMLLAGYALTFNFLYTAGLVGTLCRKVDG